MPSLYDEDVLGAKERIALAKKLQEQADNQQAGQMVSGWYVPNTGGAVVGALKNIIGAWQEKEAKGDLDKAEREKYGAVLRSMNEMGMQAPNEFALKAGTPEQQPSLWDRGKAFVTGEDQPQATPAQPMAQNVAQNVTPEQQEKALMGLITVDPSLAAPMLQQSQFKYGKDQDKQLREEALKERKEEQESNRLYRQEEAQRQREFLAQQNELNRQNRFDLANLAASLRKQGGEGGGTEKGWEVVTDKSTGMPIGRFNKITGQSEQLPNGGFGGLSQPQKQKDANEAIQLLQSAAPLINQSTSSGAGNLYDQALGYIGKSTPGADAAAALKVLGGNLVSKMPRMSGPQSDKDVELYKEMAGKIGDPTVPKSQKISAMNILNDLQSKYAGIESKPLNFDKQTSTNTAQNLNIPPNDAIQAEILRRRGGK